MHAAMFFNDSENQKPAAQHRVKAVIVFYFRRLVYFSVCTKTTGTVFVSIVMFFLRSVMSGMVFIQRLHAYSIKRLTTVIFARSQERVIVSFESLEFLTSGLISIVDFVSLRCYLHFYRSVRASQYQMRVVACT